MGTGIFVRGGEVCKEVLVSLPNIDVVDDFLPLTLGCTDIILGIKWLGSLGKMQMNWGELTMRFKVDGATIVLRGDSSSIKS